MDCNRIREQLQRSLDGAPADSALREHLAACPNCRAELTAMRRMVAGLSALPHTTAPAGLLAGVMTAVRQQPLPDLQARRQQHVLSSLAAVLALVGVLLLAVAAGDVWQALMQPVDQATAVVDASTDTEAVVEVDPVALAEQLPAAAHSGGAPFVAGLCLLFVAGAAALLSLLAPVTRPPVPSSPHPQPRTSSLQSS